jgi:hypothetical protein
VAKFVPKTENQIGSFTDRRIVPVRPSDRQRRVTRAAVAQGGQPNGKIVGRKVLSAFVENDQRPPAGRRAASRSASSRFRRSGDAWRLSGSSSTPAKSSPSPKPSLAKRSK